MSVDFISRCRYIASPFTNLKDLSSRLLVRKYGVQLCYTPLVEVSDLQQKDQLWSKLFDHFNQDKDRPLVFQLCSKESDCLVKVVNTLEGYCDAVDISHQNFNENHCPLGNEEDNWNSLLHLIQRVHNECNTAIVCKLPFNQHAIAETIKKGNMLQELGCQLLLLYRCTKERINSIVTKKDWNAVKTIRESVSIRLILDVGSSSLWEVDKCLEYTGVQGIAVSDSLESNPALFCKKQPLVSKVVEQYLDLCKIHPAPLSNIKSHLSSFCGHYLSRFHNIEANIMGAETFEDICRLVYQLSTEMSLLSKKELKSLVRLIEKKEYFKRVNGIKQEEKWSLRQKGSQSGKLKKEENHTPKVVLKKSQRKRVENAWNGSGQKIAIDFTLTEEMSNKEVSKLAAQVRRLYGSNMKSINPVHLHFTGLSCSGRIYGECVRQNVGFDNFMVAMSEKSFHLLFDRDDVVYLTPDSPYVLDKLNRDKVYIIGGLVDHHVRKEITLCRAETADLRTARLPIDEFMERRKEPGNYSSKVLTVNQVFDILLTFHETQDWPRALAAGIPPRKGLVLKE